MVAARWVRCAVAAVVTCACACRSADARPMHAGLNYRRFLEERAATADELDAWMGKFGKAAEAMDLLPAAGGTILRGTANEDATLGASTGNQDTAREDRLQRFFMAKELAREMNDRHPDANFSTDSPFSLMTEAEFSKYVQNSYLKGNASTVLRGTVKPEEVAGEADAEPETAADAETEDSTLTAGSAAGTTPDVDIQSLLKNLDFKSFKAAVGNLWSVLNGQGQSTSNAAASSSRRRLANGVTQQRPSVDWSSSSCMSPVQNQANCGACWAFATISSIETGLCLAMNGQLTKFSEQHMTSCDGNNYGCDGGSLQDGLRFAARKGLCLAKDLPYSSQNGQTGQCRSCNRYQTGLKHGYVLNTEAQLVKALQSGTVVTAVASGNRVWKQYTSGVVSSCPTNSIDHAVVVVGYTNDYFKIRNSWGAYWGEKGYIRLKRGGGGYGTCQLYSNMIQPIVKL